MIFAPTAVAGVQRIAPERRGDDRGFFARTLCLREFRAHGIEFQLVQCSTSFNPRRGTLRGLHFQAEPLGEERIIRCTRGRIFDVAVDLRPNSPTFRRWVAEILTPDNGIQLFIPKGCAHGFLTLGADSEVEYMMAEYYFPDLARGVRWNDPAFGIQWPEEPQVISDRDRTYPNFE